MLHLGHKSVTVRFYDITLHLGHRSVTVRFYDITSHLGHRSVTVRFYDITLHLGHRNVTDRFYDITLHIGHRSVTVRFYDITLHLGHRSVTVRFYDTVNRQLKCLLGSSFQCLCVICLRPSWTIDVSNEWLLEIKSVLLIFLDTLTLFYQSSSVNTTVK